jgi:ATP-binding cassette subfamily B protein
MPNFADSRTATERDQSAAAGRPLAFIFEHLRRHAAAHLVVLFSVVSAVGFAVGSQYAVKHLVDVLAAHRVGAVWWAFTLLAGMIAADNMTWRLGGWVASHCFVAVTGDVRRRLFAHLTEHSPAYFADRLPGQLAGRITATANAIYEVESRSAWNVLPPCLAVLFSIVMLATVDPLMAAILVGVTVTLGAALMRMAAGGRKLHHQYAADAAAVDGELVDVINNMPLVRAFGANLRERQRFGRRVQNEMQARGRSLRYLEKLRLFHAGTTAVLTACLLGWAVVLWQGGRASTGDVVLVSTLGFTILHGTRDLAVALVDMVQHVARLSEALTTLLLPHDLRDAAHAKPLASPRGQVEFRDVSFAYPGGPPVLTHFNLKVLPGSRVGLVGRSGSGKSTVISLLQRLRDVTEGAILIDGQNIAALTQNSLRAAISVVPQDVMLFHRSVLENIRYGRPEATDDEVQAAAAAAGCTEFIGQLEDGYDTIVGERGVKLSGGQRQRLAIARAFLRDAPVLLLDEATSALDSESELAVQRALDRLMKGRTVIAVAHRLSTLRDFDRIVVMQEGAILQDGAPEELERRSGPYRELLRRQALTLVDAAA